MSLLNRGSWKSLYEFVLMLVKTKAITVGDRVVDNCPDPNFARIASAAENRVFCCFQTDPLAPQGGCITPRCFRRLVPLTGWPYRVEKKIPSKNYLFFVTKKFFQKNIFQTISEKSELFFDFGRGKSQKFWKSKFRFFFFRTISEKYFREKIGTKNKYFLLGIFFFRLGMVTQ